MILLEEIDGRISTIRALQSLLDSAFAFESTHHEKEKEGSLAGILNIDPKRKVKQRLHEVVPIDL